MIVNTTIEVGPNIILLVGLFMPILMLLTQAFIAHRITKTKNHVDSIVAELHSDDGTTARDALNRIESHIGTIAKLPPDQRVGPDALPHSTPPEGVPIVTS